jgi:hypothetical protein
MVKKVARRRARPATRRVSKVRLLAACLTLSLASAGAALALWGSKPGAATVRLTPPAASASIAPAPPQPQNTFSPSAPAKEYVYAGGRLVATEEPPAAPTPTSTPTPAPTPTPPPLLNQTITFQQPADKTYGDQPFALSASASSGLTVSFTLISGPATLSGSTLTVTGAGVVAVRAEQAGGSGYRPAEPVTRSFMVAKATAQVTLSNLSHVYNGTPKAASVSVSPPGLAVTLTYNGSATPPTNAGSYAVSATVNAANYQGGASGTLVINRATPVITWSNPADIAEDTPLGAAQLNATANVPGTFAYTPPAGTVLGIGGGQQLSAAFTPADAANYNPNTAAVRVNVVGCPKEARSTFTAVPEFVLRGASTTLSWNVPYASDIWVSPIGNVTGPTGTTTVYPPITMQYVLEARGSGLCPVLNMRRLVTVCPDPAQAAFEAYPRTINAGGWAQLRWKNVPDVRSIVIDGVGTFGPVNDNWPSVRPSPGSPYTMHSAAMDFVWPSVRPAGTTTYTMHAVGNAGCTPVTKQATVTVGTCPTEADVTITLDSNGLSWQAPPGSTVRLGYVEDCGGTGGPACEQGRVIDQTFGASGSIAPPGTSRTLYYTLEAEDPQGCVVRSSAGVQGGSGLPACAADASFSADPGWYNRRQQDYTLTWDVPGATQVEIQKVGGGSSAGGSGPDFEYVDEVYGPYGASGGMSLQLPGPTGFRLKATTAGGGGAPSMCELYATVDGPAIYGGSAGVRTPAGERGWWADVLRLWLTASLL